MGVEGWEECLGDVFVELADRQAVAIRDWILD